MFLQEARPVLVQQHAVGLQVVRDALDGLLVLLLQRYDLAEELEATQRRLATLPGEHDLVGGNAPDVVADETLEHLLVHLSGTGSAGKRLLAQIEAVGAVEIAGRAGGLDHDVKPSRRTVAEPLRRVVLVDVHVLVEGRRAHDCSRNAGRHPAGRKGRFSRLARRGWPTFVNLGQRARRAASTTRAGLRHNVAACRPQPFVWRSGICPSANFGCSATRSVTWVTLHRRAARSNGVVHERRRLRPPAQAINPRRSEVRTKTTQPWNTSPAGAS